MRIEPITNPDLIYSGSKLPCDLLNREFEALLNKDLKINFYDHVLRTTQKKHYWNGSEIDIMLSEWSFKIHQ